MIPRKAEPGNPWLPQRYFSIDIIQIRMYACGSDMVFPDHEQGLDKIFSIPSQLRWVMLMGFVNYCSIGKTGESCIM
jgi:hypothetical protein